MEEKKGVLTEIIFHNEENGYTVGVFETEEEYFTCVGCIAEPRKGATYRLTGEFRVHPGYGEQFSFTACEEVMPEGTDEIRAFLASGTVKGIGPKTADPAPLYSFPVFPHLCRFQFPANCRRPLRQPCPDCMP